MKYCEFCGCELEDNAQCNCEKAANQQQKETIHKDEYTPEKNADYGTMFKKHKIPIIFFTVALVLLVILIGIFTSASKKNPFDYTEVSFSGYNTNGKISVDFDDYQLAVDVLGEEPDDFSEAAKWWVEYNELSTDISYTLSDEEGLSNGDIVTVEFLVMSSSSNKVKACKKDYTVSGLTEIETVDVFADVDITFEGVSGEAIAKITKKESDDGFFNALNFKLAEPDKNGTFSNGEEVEFVVSCSEYTIEEYGKAPKEKSITKTVDNLSEYAKAEDLPMDKINDYADQFLEEEYPEDVGSMITYSDAKIFGIYFAEAKEDALTYNKNELHILICYKKYVYGEYSETVHLPLIFEDITKDSDGTVTIDYEDGSGTGLFYADADEYLNELKEDYTVTNLN